MLKCILCGTGELVKLSFLTFEHDSLGIKVGFSRVNLVATTGNVALLLVELQFALLYARFRLLYLGEARICLFLRLCLDLKLLFPGFQEFLLLQHLGFLLRFFNDGLCLASTD